MDNILASGISNREHLAAFDKLAQARFAALEIEKELIYVIDSVDEDALVFLAEQFDLLGYKGWKLAQSNSEKRALLKRAIELHRYKGTPYGIKEALKYLGFTNTEIQERIGSLYNGISTFNGSINYGTGNWATFRVFFDLGNDKGIDTVQTQALLELINEYKNVRSLLLGYAWRATLDDTLIASEEMAIKIIYAEHVDVMSDGLDYNGIGSYNGLFLHNKSQDVLDVTEI